MKNLITIIFVGVVLLGSVFAIKSISAENQREMHMGGSNVYVTFQGTVR